MVISVSVIESAGGILCGRDEQISEFIPEIPKEDQVAGAVEL